MAWKYDRDAYREAYKVRRKPESEPNKEIPYWAWQALACVFVFCLLLGASKSGAGMAVDVVSTAKRIVTDDTSYQDVMTWISDLPDALATITRLDLKGFWSQATFGKKNIPIWPCDGEITSHFGWRTNTEMVGMSFHQGIDISLPEGGEILTILDGVITSIRESPSYGLVIEIEHAKGMSSVYGHLGSASVVKDQKVKKGDVIGALEGGDTPHLHFEIREDGVEIDPLTVLPPKPKTQ